ncbi:MAG: hypothetical protein HOP11_06815 [Saprospiraceae bacterium]|nr:hypothetical protein [Saprospiraceae bacterium]
MRNKLSTLLLFFVFICNVHAEVKILNVIPSTGNACTGKIIIRIEAPNVAPFEIKQDGRIIISNYQGGDYEISNVCAGMFTIEVLGNIDCAYWEFDVTVTGCVSNIQVNSKVKQECYTDNDNKNGSIALIVTGGTPPYIYKWMGPSNFLSTSKDISNLDDGTYNLLIKDSDGCTFSNLYKIDQVLNPRFTTNSTNLCYAYRNIQIHVTPLKKDYTYKWSDGIENQHNNTPPSIYQRNIDLKLNNSFYSVTITDDLTGCSVSKTINSYPENKAEVTVSNFKNPTSFNNGEIELHLIGPYLPQANIINVVSYKNNLPYVTYTFTTKNPNGTYKRKYLISNLEEGFYRFDVFEKTFCFMDDAYQQLTNCPVGVNKPNVKINNFSLPPGKPGAFVSANLIYGGDQTKCAYKWSTTDYYFIYTTLNTISGNDLASIYWPGSKALKVKVICPCGEDEDEINIDPCGGSDATKVEYKSVKYETLCYGYLPTGKKVEHKTSTILEIEVDLNTYVKGPLGISEYDNRLAAIIWSDGYPMNQKILNTSTNILTVKREITEAGIYGLTVTTSLGCNKSGWAEIKNNFQSFGPTSLQPCNWLTWCGENEPPSISYSKDWSNWTSDGRMQLIDLNECKFEYKCGINGDPIIVNGEKFEFRLQPNIPCKKRVVCDFSKVLPKFTLSKPLGTGFLEIPPTNIVGQYPDVNPIYAYYQDVEIACCTGLIGPGGTPNKYSYTGLTQGNWFPFEDIGGIFITETHPLNPCKAALKCEDGTSFLEIGSLVQDRICKNGIVCQRCFICSYNGIELDEQCITQTYGTLDCPDCFNNPLSRSNIDEQNEYELIYSNDKLFVTLKGGQIKLDELININLYSINGQFINNFEFIFTKDIKTQVVELINLKKGMYLASLTTKHGISQVLKFIN